MSYLTWSGSLCNIVQIAFGIGDLKVDSRRHYSVTNGKDTTDQLERSTCCYRMANSSLDANDWDIISSGTKDLPDGCRFSFVVPGCSCSVGINVINLFEG